MIKPAFLTTALLLSLHTAALAINCNGVWITLNNGTIPNADKIHVTNASVGGGLITHKGTFTQVDSQNYCLTHCTSIGASCVTRVQFNSTSAKNALWNIVTNYFNATSGFKAVVTINGIDQPCSPSFGSPCHITN